MISSDKIQKPMKVPPIYRQHHQPSGTTLSTFLKLMFAVSPTSHGPSTKLSMAAHRIQNSIPKVLSSLTTTTTAPTPWKAATRKPSPLVPCMVTRPTSELSQFPTRQYTATFGVTTPEVSFSMLWTLQKVRRLRPARRGRGQDLQRGDRHQPGGDGRPEAPGGEEKRSGVTT